MTVPMKLKYAVAVLGALGLLYTGYHYRDVTADNEMLVMKNKAQAELIVQQQKVAEYERVVQTIANKVQEQNYENQKKHDKELAYYRNLVNQLGGLYDHGSQTNNSTTTGGSTSNQTTTSGTALSGEAVAFLLQMTNEADRVVDQYLQCQQYVLSLTEQAVQGATK